MKSLIVCPEYFNYHNVIKSAFKRNGHDIDMVTYSNKCLIPFVNGLIKSKKKTAIIRYLQSVKYDFIIVIKGDIMTWSEWGMILDKVVSVKILYQWDSMANFDYSEALPIFTRVYSFDRNDSQRCMSIQYLPLFYDHYAIQDVTNNKKNSELDLLFIGIWHSDRLKMLDIVDKQARDHNLKTYFRVYYPFLTWLYLRIKKGRIMSSPFLTFRKISNRKVYDLYNSARCVVDIAHPQQSGLTMRTIECVGCGKKLITTNENIVFEPFYSEDNIQILYHDKPEIDFSFLNKETVYENKKDYSIDSFIKKLLSYE